MQLFGLDLVQSGKDIFKDAGEHDITGFAAQLAYRFFLALFPFFIFLAALGGFVADALDAENPTQSVMDLIGDSLPQDSASILRNELDEIVGQNNPGLLSIGIVGALWASGGGVGALIKGFNRIYRVEETRPLLRRYALVLGLTAGASLLIISAFILMVVGESYGRELMAELGLGGLGADLVTLARWPAAFLALLAATAFLYWTAPNVRLPFTLVSPGAVLFSAGWVIATYAFGLYVANFANYNATYGTLGGIVILLFWFYLTGLLLLIGAEINVYLTRQKAPGELATAAVESPDASPQSGGGDNANRNEEATMSNDNDRKEMMDEARDRADDVRDRVDSAAEVAQERATRVAGQVQERLEEQAGRAAQGLRQASDRLNGALHDGNSPVGKAAQTLSDGLHTASDQIDFERGEKLPAVGGVFSFARKHPVQATLGAIVIGLLLGRILRG